MPSNWKQMPIVFRIVVIEMKVQDYDEKHHTELTKAVSEAITELGGIEVITVNHFPTWTATNAYTRGTGDKDD
jgi:hypothetical protein